MGYNRLSSPSSAVVRMFYDLSYERPLRWIAGPTRELDSEAVRAIQTRLWQQSIWPDGIERCVEARVDADGDDARRGMASVTLRVAVTLADELEALAVPTDCLDAVLQVLGDAHGPDIVAEGDWSLAEQRRVPQNTTSRRRARTA